MQILVMLGFDVSNDIRQDADIKIAVGCWQLPLLFGSQYAIESIAE